RNGEGASSLVPPDIATLGSLERPPARCLRLLGSGMSLIVDLQHVLDGQLSVALGRRKALVAEHLLNRAQVSAFLQHVSSERVPQRVRMNVWRQTLGNCDFLDDPAHAAGGEPPAAPVDQQGRQTLFALRQYLLAGGQVVFERHRNRVAEEDIALFLSLAPDKDGLIAQADV